MSGTADNGHTLEGVRQKMSKVFGVWNKAGNTRNSPRTFLSIAIALSLTGFGVPPAHASDVTITYSNSGATSGSAPDSQTVAANSSPAPRPPGSLAKTGLVFKGWSTAASGGGTFYAYPGNISVGTESITLYPAFGGTVNFNANGGFGTPGSTSLEFVENRSFTLPNQGTLSKSGFNFGGWRDSTTSAGFSGAGSSFTLPSGTKSGTILYAAWTRTVQYSPNGATIGSAPSNQTWLENTSGLAVPSSINSGIQRRGFDHVGWGTSANARSAVGPTFVPGNANTVLYAAWNAQPTLRRVKIDFKPRTDELTDKSIARLDSLKVLLSPTATFPKKKIKIFLGSWRHSSQSANLGKKKISAVRKIIRDAGIPAKFVSSNDSRSSGSSRDARNNRIDLISEWRN